MFGKTKSDRVDVPKIKTTQSVGIQKIRNTSDLDKSVVCTGNIIPTGDQNVLEKPKTAEERRDRSSAMIANISDKINPPTSPSDASETEVNILLKNNQPSKYSVRSQNSDREDDILSIRKQGSLNSVSSAKRIGTSSTRVSKISLLKKKSDCASSASKIPRMNTTKKTPSQISKSATNDGVLKTLESKFISTKKKVFIQKKELEEKQKAFVEILNEATKLSGRIRECGKDVNINVEAKLVEFNEFKHKEEKKKITNITTFNTRLMDDITVDFSVFETDIQKHILNIPNEWIILVKFLLDTRNSMVDWIKKQDLLYDKADKDADEIMDRKTKVDEETKKRLTKVCSEVRKLYENRELLKSEIKLIKDTTGVALMSEENLQLSKKLRDIVEKLEAENERAEKLTSQIQNMRNEVKRSKLKVKELEILVENKDDQLAALEEKLRVERKVKEVKSLHCGDLRESKARDQLKAKEMKSKQELVEILENRIVEITHKNSEIKREADDTIKRLQMELKNAKAELAAERENCTNLMVLLQENEAQMTQIRAKTREFTDVAEKNKLLLPGLKKPSNRERELYAELEAVRIIVKGYEEKFEKMKQEKMKLLLEFENVSGDDRRSESEKHAAQLIIKEEVINKQKIQMEELQRKCEEHAEDVCNIQNKLEEFQEGVRKSGQEEQLNTVQDLRELRLKVAEQQQIVADLVTHKRELESALTQKSLELEHRDKMFRQQLSIIKVRDDLVQLLHDKGKVPNGGSEPLCVKDSKWEQRAESICNDLVDKSQNIKEMESMLHEKFKQVETLTRVIKQMEDQQDRAQEQRVRFEAKIADLQRQLHLTRK